VEHLEPLTKSDLISFYNASIAPSSTTRAKIAVHLVAQGSPAAVLDNASPEAKAKLISAAATDVVKQGMIATQQTQAAGGLQTPSVSDPPTEVNSNKPTLIEDVRAFKAGLQLSPGPQPAKHLTEYEDTEAKL
jgi:insulysin